MLSIVDHPAPPGGERHGDVGRAPMGSLTWKGGPGQWSDSADWAIVSGTDNVPGAGDDVPIAAPTNYVVTLGPGSLLSGGGNPAYHALVAGDGTLVNEGTIAASELEIAIAFVNDGVVQAVGPLVTLGDLFVDSGMTNDGTVILGGTAEAARGGLTVGALSGSGDVIIVNGTAGVGTLERGQLVGFEGPPAVDRLYPGGRAAAGEAVLR
jgi:hypothetical protein